MEAGISDKPKRKISVGFIQPEELQGDIIYVQLKKKFPYGHVLADAVSGVEFNYLSESIGGNELHKRGVKATNRYGGISENDYSYKTPEVFLKMLEQQNDAVVSEDRRNEDGLSLTVIVSKAIESIEEFQGKISFMKEKFK